MKSRTRRLLVVAFLGIGGVLAVGLFSAPRRRPLSGIDLPIVRVATPSSIDLSSPQEIETVPTPEIAVAPLETPVASKRRSRKKRKLVGLVLAILMVVGGIATTNGSFSAQTRNPGNAFASGTLVLANTKQGASTCLSTAGGTTDTNVNNLCDQLIGVSVRKPGDTSSGKVTLRNNGSIGASALQFYLSGCTTSNAPGESFNGTGNMCNNVSVFIQEYSDAAFTTPSSCKYGGGTATVCAHDPAKTLTTLQTAYTSGAPLGLGAQAAGVSEYYEIGVQFLSSADNTLQGRRATFDLTWVMIQ